MTRHGSGLAEHLAAVDGHARAVAKADVPGEAADEFRMAKVFGDADQTSGCHALLLYFKPRAKLQSSP
jgi:hypothetical protein